MPRPRRLFLHLTALSDQEYDIYSSALKDLLDHSDKDPQVTDDAALENAVFSAREIRCWMNSRYKDVGSVNQILRMFAPSLGPTDTLTGGQFLAALRILTHARSGHPVAERLVFIQATPSSPSVTPSFGLDFVISTPASFSELHSPNVVTSTSIVMSNPFKSDPTVRRADGAEQRLPALPSQIPPTTASTSITNTTLNSNSNHSPTQQSKSQESQKVKFNVASGEQGRKRGRSQGPQVQISKSQKSSSPGPPAKKLRWANPIVAIKETQKVKSVPALSKVAMREHGDILGDERGNTVAEPSGTTPESHDEPVVNQQNNAEGMGRTRIEKDQSNHACDAGRMRMRIKPRYGVAAGILRSGRDVPATEATGKVYEGSETASECPTTDETPEPVTIDSLVDLVRLVSMYSKGDQSLAGPEDGKTLIRLVASLKFTLGNATEREKLLGQATNDANSPRVLLNMIRALRSPSS